MSKLNLKLKVDLKKQIEEKNSKKRASDPRILNYYDLKEDQRMKVLFVPDVNGQLWHYAKKHGPNMKVRGLDDIRCLEDSGQKCPICEVGFGLYGDAKKASSKEETDAIRAEAKRWMPKELTIMSCIVLESPIEVPYDSTHNEVKLFLAPYSIQEHIKNALVDGDISEDDITSTPFTIKKTVNQGGQAEYKHSKFERRPLEDGALDFLDDLVVEQYDFTKLDPEILAVEADVEQAIEWIEKAEAAIAKEKKDAKANADSESTHGASTRGKADTSSKVGDRLNSRLRGSQSNDQDDDDTASDRQEDQRSTGTISRLSSNRSSDSESDSEKESNIERKEQSAPKTGSRLRDRIGAR